MKQTTLEKIRERAKKIRKRKVVAKRWLYPIGIEREYHRVLKRLVNHTKALIKQYLIPEIPSMMYEVNIKTPNDRADTFLDRLQGLILFIRQNLRPDLEASLFEAEEIALDLNRWNKAQFDKVALQVHGVNPFISEPWLTDQMQIFSAQNAQLISSLPDQELDRVSGIIERGLQEGTQYKEVAKEIQKSFGISSRRASLIARDQTKKLNTSLTKLRQQELGVEEYIWQTSGDERVRNSHAVMDGKKCRWDDPTVFFDDATGKWKKKSTINGEPLAVGMAIRCRCEPIAVLDNLLDTS